MVTFKISIIVLFLIILSSFSMFAPDEYVLLENVSFLLAINAVCTLFIINETRTKFEETFMKISVLRMTFNIYWKNFYQFFIIIFIPLLISISFLISLELKLFTVIFSICFLQNMLIVFLYRTLYSKINIKHWRFIASLLSFSIVLSQTFEIEGIINFNPLLNFAYTPFLFSDNSLLINVIFSMLLIYSVIYLINFLVIRKNKITAYH